jgi:hypothetical protein
MQDYSPIPQLFQLSQAHLNCLTTCPRKFQYLYLDQLNSPQSPEQQVRQERGARFHWLMQQQELGLRITPFLHQDCHLQRWFQAFTQAPPQMQAGERLSEHRQSLRWQNYLLVAVYDLLILGEQQAQILDWKTYPQPQNLRSLQASWQTRLYPFILVEATDYSPSQVTMTYWFAEANPQSQDHSLTLPYSEALHRQTRRDLAQILDQLTAWLQAHRQGQGLPQVEISAGHCQGESPCNFVIRCRRQPSSDPPVNLDAIAEIPL